MGRERPRQLRQASGQRFVVADENRVGLPCSVSRPPLRCNSGKRTSFRSGAGRAIIGLFLGDASVVPRYRGISDSSFGPAGVEVVDLGLRGGDLGLQLDQSGVIRDDLGAVLLGPQRGQACLGLGNTRLDGVPVALVMIAELARGVGTLGASAVLARAALAAIVASSSSGASSPIDGGPPWS